VSHLFFVVQDMSKIEKVYQFSLEFLKEQFEISVEAAVPGPKDRIKNIIEAFKFQIFKVVSMYLLEKDKM